VQHEDIREQIIRDIWTSFVPSQHAKRLLFVSPVDFKDKLSSDYGIERVCIWCGVALSGRRWTYCSEDCRDSWLYRTLWSWIQSKMCSRADYKCRMCGHEAEHFLRDVEGYHKIGEGMIYVHHRIPVGLGGDPFDTDNMVVVCSRCHGELHRGGNHVQTARKRVDRMKNQRTLSGWT